MEILQRDGKGGKRCSRKMIGGGGQRERLKRDILTEDEDRLQKDSDVLTTSPLQDRSEIESKLNPFKCADQWGEARKTRPRLDGRSSVRMVCDWTVVGLGSEMHQPHGALQHQGGNG